MFFSQAPPQKNYVVGIFIITEMVKKKKFQHGILHSPDSTPDLQPTVSRRSAPVSTRPVRVSSPTRPPVASFGACPRQAHDSAAEGGTCHRAPRCLPGEDSKKKNELKKSTPETKGERQTAVSHVFHHIHKKTLLPHCTIRYQQGNEVPVDKTEQRTR